MNCMLAMGGVVLAFFGACAMQRPLCYAINGDELSLGKKVLALVELGQANPKMRALSLCNMRLTELPEFMVAFTHLRSLDLSGNQLDESVAPVIGTFKHLRYLNLNGNRFTTLPRAFMHLVHVRDLRLADNRIAEVEDSWESLPQLRTLDLAGNDLTTIDPSIEKLSKLENLLLDANELKKLPDSLGTLPSLMLLTLTHNRFKSRPAVLDRLRDAHARIDPTDDQRVVLDHKPFDDVVVYYDASTQRCKNRKK